MLTRTAVILLFLVTLAYLLIGVDSGLSHYDEGLVTTGAMVVLAGGMPHRDFWSNYAPGQYYALAAVFRLFGASLWAERLFATLVMALLLTLVYHLARRLEAHKWSYAAWAVGLAWVGLPVAAGNLGTSLLCALGSYLCWLNFLGTRQRAWSLAAGLLAGLTALFRHDLGVYTLLSHSLVVGDFLWRQTNRGRPLLGRLTYLLRQGLGAYLLGFALVVAPVVVIFLVKVPLPILRYDFVDFPLRIYPRVRGVPYPCPLSVLRSALAGAGDLRSVVRDLLGTFPFYFPFAVWLVALAWLVAATRTRRLDWQQTRPWRFLLLLAVSVLYFLHALVRHDQGHLLATALPCALLLAAIVQDLTALLPTGSPRRRALTAGAIAIVGLLLFHPVWTRTHLLLNRLAGPLLPRFQVERARGICLGPEEVGYQDALLWIQRNVPPDEPIFVGNFRHDRIFINDALFYFLSGRPPATRYYELHPGIATTRPIQEEIIRELESKAVRFVVLADMPLPPHEHVGPPDSPLLDDYLRRTFAPVCNFGRYVTCVRSAALPELRLTPCGETPRLAPTTHSAGGGEGTE